MLSRGTQPEWAGSATVASNKLALELALEDWETGSLEGGSWFIDSTADAGLAGGGEVSCIIYNYIYVCLGRHTDTDTVNTDSEVTTPPKKRSAVAWCALRHRGNRTRIANVGIWPLLRVSVHVV